MGRREGALRDTATRIGGDKFHAIVADVSTPEGRGAIADGIGGAASTILVHNATTASPGPRRVDAGRVPRDDGVERGRTFVPHRH